MKISRAIFTITLLFSSSVFAKEVVVPLPNRDDLVVDMPEGWRSHMPPVRKNFPPTIEITPDTGPDFLVTLTPLWFAKGVTPPPSENELKEMTQEAVDTFRPRSIEREFPLLTLDSDSVRGYYFSATDRSPTSADYKHVLQGVVGLAELRIAFSILGKSENKALNDQALQMLKNMRRKAKAP